MSKNFVVYKSSAGSGKTTTLVKEYLKIALRNPDRFRHILAITFTNKAANEMKQRILESLKEIVSKDFNPENRKSLLDESGLSVQQAKERAARLQYNILHTYDEFAVSTIDSFVHQIVRTFSTDLKLPQGFEVLIDQDDIVPFIVEDLYDKLGNDKAFTEILLQYVLSQVEDEKSYDLNRNLSRFVEKQLSEPGTGETGEPEKLSAGDYLNRIKKLRKALRATKTELIELAEKGLQIMEEARLSPADFKGGAKSSVGGYLLKLQKWQAKPTELFLNKAAIKAVENNEWYAQKLAPEKKQRIQNIAADLKGLLEAIGDKMHRHMLLQLVYKNIYEMALIGEIRQLFEDFTNRTRKVHISEFNKRIHSEIAGQPVPYIYERLGRRFRHFLVDEFQDTSVLQWENLLPLIEESLANGQFNMLVGDAKQAIYRFRHGEVELFTHLPKLYGVEKTPVNLQREDTLGLHYEQKSLRFNYRSREQVIRFNNAFFQWAGKTLGDGFHKVYEDAEQQLPEPPKTGGYVSIDFIPSENTEDFRKNRLDKIEEIVASLRNNNYPLKDICILTLKNKSATEIASHLLQHQIPVITSESLLLTTSPAVRLTVAAMKLQLDSQNKLWFAEFLMSLLQLLHREGSFHQCYTEAAGREDPFHFILEKFGMKLPDKALMRKRSVYEMAADIIRHLLPGETPDPFLLFFLDFVFEKEPVYYGSLPAFLKLWEEKKSKLSIVFPEGIDAVQIMTAHKAKGLKFGTVVADLHEMNNRLTREQYWESVDIPELEGLSDVLLNISQKELAVIGREQVYQHEKAKTDLDFLNKVYVAFTRPVDGLFVIGSRIKNSTKDIFSKKLTEYLESRQLYREEQWHYEWGSFPVSPAAPMPQKNAETLSKNFSVPWYGFLEIAPVEEVFWTSAGQKAPRTFGKILHAILAKIKYAEEAEQQVNGWRYSGLLDEDEATEILQMLHAILHHPQLSGYFSHDATIKTETEVYDAKAATYKRPDRVVLREGTLTILDYKTGTRNPETERKYRKQISDYAAIYARMGYDRITKKLVYIRQTEVEVVEV